MHDVSNLIPNKKHKCKPTYIYILSKVQTAPFKKK